jgi:hypothetical protein
VSGRAQVLVRVRVTRGRREGRAQLSGSAQVLLASAQVPLAKVHGVPLGSWPARRCRVEAAAIDRAKGGPVEGEPMHVPRGPPFDAESQP